MLTVARLDAAEGYKGCDSSCRPFRPSLMPLAGSVVVVGGGDDLRRLRAASAELRFGGQVTFSALCPTRSCSVTTGWRMPSPCRVPEGLGLSSWRRWLAGYGSGGGVDGTNDALDDGALGLSVDRDLHRCDHGRAGPGLSATGTSTLGSSLSSFESDASTSTARMPSDAGCARLFKSSAGRGVARVLDSAAPYAAPRYSGSGRARRTAARCRIDDVDRCAELKRLAERVG